jgi:hypothetical protein
LVEQSIRNRQVIGSSPIVGSIILVPLRGNTAKQCLFSISVLLLLQQARRVVGLAFYHSI